MLEPGAGQTPVSRLALCQFADHLALRPGVRKHIHEVEDDDVQLVLQERWYHTQELLAIIGIIYLIIREGVILPEAVDLGLNERRFVQVLTFLALFIHPQIGEELLDLRRHQSGEDGIAGILRSRREDAVIEALVEGIKLRQEILYHPPLVHPEIIYQDEEYLLACIQERKNTLLEEVGTHQRTVVGLPHPIFVMVLHEFTKGIVRLFLLHEEHLLHRALGAAFQLQFPIDDALVELHPFVRLQPIVDAHAETGELLLVTLGRSLRNDHILVHVLFNRKQELVRIERFDEVIGNFIPDSLVHDALLFALRNHDHRRIRGDFLDVGKRFQSGQSRHVLVQKDNVERLLAAKVDRVLPAYDWHHLVALLRQEKDVGF